MITHYNFAIKMKTKWGKKVVKSISDARNTNDVSMHI